MFFSASVFIFFFFHIHTYSSGYILFLIAFIKPHEANGVVSLGKRGSGWVMIAVLKNIL